MDSSDGQGSFFESKSSLRCRHVDEDPVRGFGGSLKPGEVAGFEKTVKTPRVGRFPPPRRGPRRHSCLGLLTALDAARRPSPPSVPRPTPVTSTTWRLQPPSASLVLWRKPRNPPSVAACALDPGVDAATVAWSELRSGCPSPPSITRSIGHSTTTAAPRRHSTPVYLQSKDQAHDHTAWLIIHSSQAG